MAFSKTITKEVKSWSPPYNRSSKSRCSRASGQRGNTTGHPALPGGLFHAIGTPLTDGTWTYTWEKGRQLKKMVKTGETVEFKYNENGLCIQKVATSTGTTNYTLHGKNIVHMTQGNNSLHFFYDASNKPAIVNFNGTKYAYVHNLQGDIVAILDSAGNKVVQYAYDAWGRPIKKEGSLASTLGTVQPFRYRGYVYDEETGLYYLRSRYYSSKVCRFVNSDSILGKKSLISHNIYAYCKSDPIMKIDADGLASDSSFPLFGFLYLSAFLPGAENLDKNRPTDLSAYEDTFTSEFIDSIYLNTELTKIINSIPAGLTSTSTSKPLHWTPKWAAYPFSSDGDLAFALGTINMDITVEKVAKGPLEWMKGFGDKYRVKYSFSDLYDFHKLEISLDNIPMIIPNAINNYLGYMPQEAGLLQKYYYSVSGEYYIYVADLFGTPYVNGGYQ